MRSVVLLDTVDGLVRPLELTTVLLGEINGQSGGSPQFVIVPPCLFQPESSDALVNVHTLGLLIPGGWII